ncbi:MAG: glycine zipper domain-containing protein [Bacteroidota bacterium]
MTAASSATAPRRNVRFAAALIVSVSLVGCATTQNGGGVGGMGQKETVGTGAGALLGGIAGSFLGKGQGRIVGALAGAAIGGFVGNRIGAMMDEEDQKALQEQAKQALLTQPDNSQVSWASARSDATATVVPENTRVETREVRVVREANVAPAPQLDLIGAKYVAKAGATVRLSPSNDAEVATTLANGSTVWAVGKVRNQPWIMVAKKGKSIGYVPAASLAPAVQTAAAKPSQPTPRATQASAPAQPAAAETAAAPFDLDAAPVRTPADLDALAPTEKADVVVASVTCRDIRTTASAKGETATSTQTACKSPDGSWELN